jgi:hypothetical protein
MSLPQLVVLALLAVLAPPQSQPAQRKAAPATTMVTVYKDPNCGCCQSWVEHIRKHGFAVTVHDTNDMSGAKSLGRVPKTLQTCHTAFVNGYVVEGHVPAADIKRMLDEKPKIAGIGVAGMPAGSPGMETGKIVEKYNVIAFTREGTTYVFARH